MITWRCANKNQQLKSKLHVDLKFVKYFLKQYKMYIYNHFSFSSEIQHMCYAFENSFCYFSNEAKYDKQHVKITKEKSIQESN
jgi:uncharacterized membrane-anchored protein YhcB (DUF1043 family)